MYLPDCSIIFFAGELIIQKPLFSSDKERFVLELIIELLGFPDDTCSISWFELPLWGAINPLLNRNGKIIENSPMKLIFDKQKQPGISQVILF